MKKTVLLRNGKSGAALKKSSEHASHLDVPAILQAAAFSVVAHAVVIADCHGKILWLNDAFTRLTGYSREEAIRAGHPDAQIRPPFRTFLPGSLGHRSFRARSGLANW